MLSHNHSTNCATCTRRIVSHKPALECNLCAKNYHPKCVKLNPSDVKSLVSANLYNTWICLCCKNEIFPQNSLISNTDNSSRDNIAKTRINKTSREYCATCTKLGNKMVTCDLCGFNSHKRCFAGILGCKGCMRNIYPGYDITFSELFTLTGNNYTRFNPFSYDSDLNNIGFSDALDSETEQMAWSTSSQLLDNCKYYELTEINNSRSYEFKILSLNIRSIKQKIHEIIDNIDHFSKFDALCFNESNCSPDKLPFGGRELELDNFHPPIIQNPARGSSRGGGLIIYLNKDFCSITDYNILTNLSDRSDPSKGEFLFIEISKKFKNIIIGNMYRSPSGDPIKFIDNLENRLKALRQHKNKHIILASDSNIDLLKFQKHEPTTKFVNCLSEYGFVPTISLPTRVTSHSATLIDHIFVNHCAAVTKSGIITADLSDHLATFVNIVIDTKKLNSMATELDSTFTRRCIVAENLENFKKDINNVDWNFLSDIDSADEKFSNFEAKYREIYDKNFPRKISKKGKHRRTKPWLLPWLQNACARKNRYYKDFIKIPTEVNKSRYNKIKKFVAKHIKKAKHTYYENYFKQYSDDGRKQWQMINQLLNRKTKSKIEFKKIIFNDKVVTDPREIAHDFNDFFVMLPSDKRVNICLILWLIEVVHQI